MQTASLLPIPFAGACRLSSAEISLATGNRAPSGQASELAQVSRVGGERRGAIVFGRLRGPADAPRGASTAWLPERLLACWLEQGDAVLEGLSGEFLLACWDADAGRALIAVDRFSTYPLFWASRDGRLAFSTRAEEAAAQCGVAHEIDWQAAFSYAYFHMVPAPQSIYRQVARLDHGEALRVERGRVEVWRYWSPVFDEHRPFDMGAERAAFLAALNDGVAECTAGFAADEIGCFLSGGTDSSTIAGLVTRHFGRPARTFSIGFDVGGYDESQYSRLAARHFGTEHTEYYLTADDVLAGVEQVARCYEQPFGNSSAVPTYFCAGLAAQAGVKRMLGGDGGDELYGGNERYAKQAIFGLYDRVPSLLRESLIEPLLSGPLKHAAFKPVAKARSYVEQANEPLPDRLQGRYNLVNFLGAEAIFSKAMLERVSLEQPLVLEREVWSRASARQLPLSQLDALLARDFKFTLADSDLPKVTRMCHAAGVEVAFPMLTRALVEHSLRLQPGQKLHRQRLRHFFKESLRGFLPDEIIEKKKQGFGVPFGDWLLGHPKLRARAEEALRALAARGVIRAEFLEQLLTRMQSGHAGYYGTMVWVLMIFELWLQASPLADERLV